MQPTNNLTKVIRFKIQDYFDREQIVIGFASSGYKVWVEEEKIPNETTINFFVCVEEKCQQLKS